MSTSPAAPLELSSRYDPKEHENRIYALWRERDCFAPAKVAPGGAEPFVVMLPPPNVTGVLHMGHALNGTLQDIVTRFQRMRGRDTLWVPGLDHAGIATQAVVEKKLYAEHKLTRQQLGREAFVASVWKWKEEHGSKILEQYARLGASFDWSRLAFTLDEDLSSAVRESFVRLWEQGLIYRGARLVNWDCVLQTAVSDDEIEYEEKRGKLYHLSYPIEGAPGEFITVATTRPETMLGDTGVAVHPEDERWARYIGKHAVLPFLGRRILIVGDTSVERGFGTGAVKITPGHDPADYERGARFKLPTVNILEPDGRLNAEGGPFAGLTREKAREALVKRLEEQGLCPKIEDITHNVAVSDRSKSPIEPLVSEQWFVKMEPLAKPAIAAVKSGALKFRPERWSKVYLDWLENVRDWCISRQLWWGHQIPVWYDEDGLPVASRTDLVLGSRHPLSGKAIVRRDEDVLDTWASSWLWPLATLGWPNSRDPDLLRFYPTHFLSTAREIIYLWVARMIMAGYAFADHLPPEKRCAFATCYVHATVLDAKGRRMSKSAGNGIDPIEMIEQFGADAVRFSLLMLTKEGQDVKLAADKFEQGSRFTNKVWNAARFVLANLAGPRGAGTLAEAERLEDRWILSRLEELRAALGEDLEHYRFNQAANALYRFVWNDFCDWYLELVKPRLQAGDSPSARAARGTLARVLGDVLCMLHPFTPFQTEVLWGALQQTLGLPSTLLIREHWPTGAGLARDAAAEADMGVVQEFVRAVRNVRALTSLGERKPLIAIVAAPREAERRVLQEHETSVRALAFLERFELHTQVARPPRSAVAVAAGVEVFVPLEGEVDLDKLRETVARRVEKLKVGLASSDAKLANPGFVQRAEPEVVEEERARRAELAHELEMLERNLRGL